MASSTRKAKVTILGCGPSMGVPVLGCSCGVCKSSDPRNQRTRTSLLYESAAGDAIVFDTGPEFRLQLLRANISRLEHVVYTHTHADHSHGFDDLRGLFFNQNKDIHCYLAPDDLVEIRGRFSYTFEAGGYHAARPQIHLHQITAPFTICGVELEPVVLPHGHQTVLGFRLGRFAYATDFKAFSIDQIAAWRGKIDTIVVSALRRESHVTHSSVSESVALINQLEARRGILTHLSHDLEFGELTAELPPHISAAYDGLTIDLP